MMVSELLARLERVRPNGKGWTARCPAHEDRQNSLSIGEGDEGRILVNCFAGCDAAAIVAAVGLELRDLFPERERPTQPAGRGTRYEIRDVAGEVVAVHVRKDSPDGTKTFLWEQPDGASGLKGRGVATLPLFGAERLAAAPTDAAVLVVEGEKAAAALRARAFLSVGTVTGAAGTPGVEALRPLLGRPVILWPDADEPGRAHMDRIAASLRQLGHHSIRVMTWREAPPKGDAFDFFDRGGTALQVRGLMADARLWTPAGAGDDAAASSPLLVPVAQLSAPAVTFLVEALLPNGMLAILSGRDKRGKTLLAQEVARAVLTGAPLFEHFAVRRGPVVGAFLDDPLAITLGRLDTLGVRAHPRFYAIDPLRFGDDPVAFLDRLEAEAATVRPALIVIDALYLLAPTTRDAGNDASRMTPVMRRLDRLATTTAAAVLLICHDNKAGADVAGSFVVRAMAKTILRLTLPRGEETDDPDAEPTTPRRLLKIESKLAPAATVMLELKGVGNWLYLGEPKAVRATDIETEVERHLVTQPSASASEIAEAIDRRKADVLAALGRLVEAGRLVEEREAAGPRGGRPRVRFRVSVSPDRAAWPKDRDPSVHSATEGVLFPRGREQNPLLGEPGNKTPDTQVCDVSTESATDGASEGFCSASIPLEREKAEQNPPVPVPGLAAGDEPNPEAAFRERLVAWGAAHGWPRLPFRRGRSIVAGEETWRIWLRRAELHDLRAAVEAADQRDGEGAS